MMRAKGDTQHSARIAAQNSSHGIFRLLLNRTSSSNPLTWNSPHLGKVLGVHGCGRVDRHVGCRILGFVANASSLLKPRGAITFQVVWLVFHAFFMNQLQFPRSTTKLFSVCLACASSSFLFTILPFTLCVSIPSSLSLPVLFSLFCFPFCLSLHHSYMFSLVASFFFLESWYHSLTLSFAPLLA